MQAYIEYLKSSFENINVIFIDFMVWHMKNLKNIMHCMLMGSELSRRKTQLSICG